MNSVTIGVLLAMVAGAILIALRLRPDMFRGAHGPAQNPDAPTSPAAIGPPLAPAPSVDDPLLARLLGLRERFMAGPRVYNPDDLLKVPAFVALVDGLADPAMETARLLEFWESDDAAFSWAALCALARRTPAPAPDHDREQLENRLLVRINSFIPWCRYFLLRVLEAWNPDDPRLAGLVLVRLNDSWDRDECGVMLDQFLRRRVAVAPLSIRDIKIPPRFDKDDLESILRRQVDPALAAPLLMELAQTPFDDAPHPTKSNSSGDEQPVAGTDAALREIGQLRKPGKVGADGVIASPSADAALEQVRAALLGKPRRSALVVGEAGVGKTSLVRRLAARLSSEGWTIFEASAVQVNAGMSFTGSLGGRLQVMRKALAQPKTLWIVPDFHQLLWQGRHIQNPTGILEMIVPAVDSGEILILGETRPALLESVLTERPEVRRLFEIVRLSPPADAEVETMLGEWSVRVAQRKRVAARAPVTAEAMALARQFLSNQAAPGGVLQLLDGALENAAGRAGADDNVRLGVEDLIAALARLTGLPQEILDERRILDLEGVRQHFEARVVGQSEAVNGIVERLALLKAGITDPTRPTGVFLFAGPSGTGKTELAKTLAAYLFGSADRLVRIDMSELQDPGALERILGAGSSFGPVGNSLAERVRRQPFCVVLLDEFEKAHPRIWDLFLQVFDDGRLTDPQGQTTDFRQAIIIMTSNLGSAISGETKLGIVGSEDGFSPTAITRAVERAFRPEMRNRLDRVVIFRPLTREVMRTILRKELADAFARRGLRRREWAVELEESAIELLIERGFSPTLGARPLKRALEQLLLAPLAATIVDRRAPEGDQFLFVRADGDRLAVEFVDPDAPVVSSGLAIAQPHAEMTAIALEARGSRAEVESLRAALATIRIRIEDPVWREAKQALLLEAAAPEFWKRDDRFERLGRAEYLDRIESATRGAASLLDRLEGRTAAPREGYPRDMVRRLGQQLYLLEAASREAIADGPRDAFVAIEPMLEDSSPGVPAREFAGRLAAMYAAWARARGMRFAEIETPEGSSEGHHLLAIAGFAAYALLLPEEGLHVLEEEEPGRATRRTTVRVRVLPQPAEPARDGVPGLLRQARERLTRRTVNTTQVARRYRDGAAPLVRDTSRGWRTNRLDRVMAGDFDLMQARE